MKYLPALCVIVLATVSLLVAASGTATTSIRPQALGSVTFFPNFDLLFVRDTGRMLSSCSNTTGENLEFNRGFMEFSLPVVPMRVVKATLIVTETRTGTTTTPKPPDVHELSVYPADLVIGTADYDASADLIGTFETDVNDPPDLRRFTFDVTDAIRRLRKRDVGFRIKMQIDPDGPCDDFAGSEFGDVSIERPTLEIEFRGHSGSSD
jgi:hypothetical protein